MDQKVVLKSLNLVEITPNWANKVKALAEVGFPFPFSLQWWKWYFKLDSPSRCIVGEAHGYTSNYENECKTCDRLGWEFGHSFLIRSKEEFEGNIEEFVTHWNEKHSS
jgi:hypothetical protein